MAEIIRLRKGLDINLLGTPAETVTELKVAILEFFVQLP